MTDVNGIDTAAIRHLIATARINDHHTLDLCDEVDRLRAENLQLLHGLTYVERARLMQQVHNECSDEHDRMSAERDAALARVAELEAENERVRALFAAGPDTACRTVWQDGVECVSVPIADLGAALDGVGESSDSETTMCACGHTRKSHVTTVTSVRSCFGCTGPDCDSDTEDRG